MLRKSISKIISSSLQCSRRGFSSKKPQKPHNEHKEWWNEPIDECKPCEETIVKSKTLQLPAPEGPKTVSVVDSEKIVSYSSYDDVPCHEKKFSPCAEKAKAKTEPLPVVLPEIEENQDEKPKSDCTDHKSLVPPSNILEKLKCYEVKSVCTTFKINSSN